MKDGFVKAAAATPDIRVADVAYNTENICKMIDETVANGAKVIVFPELCVTGYTCSDLFMQDILLKEAKEALFKIADYTKEKDALIFIGVPLAVDGELYNVDGNSNRVACIVYGPRQVIMIVGVNKIVENLDEAILRVKTICAPMNTERLGIATPCNKTGKCISLSKENPFMCDGCGGNTRICCNYVVSAKQRHKDRIKLIIVNENLGY